MQCERLAGGRANGACLFLQGFVGAALISAGEMAKSFRLQRDLSAAHKNSN